MSTVLFVCTGNICRSPMAEGLLREELRRRGISGVEVDSVGVAGWDGSPATKEAIQALAEKGIDITTHVARRVVRQDIEEADLVLALAGEHREAVLRMVPRAAGRTFTLKELVNLLDHLSGSSSEDDPEARLRAVVQRADARRSAISAAPEVDEDVADPLGLGLEAFKAAAWELSELCSRLAIGLFDAEANGRSHDVQASRQEALGP